MNLAMDEEDRENMKKGSVRFNKDKTYISFIGTEIAEKGTWKYNPRKRELICESMNGDNATTILILAISADEIIAESFLENEKSQKFRIVLRSVK